MCTIGWIKLKDSWIIFKNRDRADEANDNIFVQDKDIVGFGAKDSTSIWAGINKYGVGITSAHGPVRNVQPGMLAENFTTNEKVLRKSKTVEEAAEKYLELAKNLGRSFNILICDSEKALNLETIPHKSFFKEKYSYKSLLKTNYFTNMTEYNKASNQDKVKRSEARLKKLTELVSKVKSGKDLIPILSSHSENELENICRHDYAKTVGSAIFEIKDEKINIYYCLNESPHNGNYKHKVIENFFEVRK